MLVSFTSLLIYVFQTTANTIIYLTSVVGATFLCYFPGLVVVSGASLLDLLLSIPLRTKSFNLNSSELHSNGPNVPEILVVWQLCSWLGSHDPARSLGHPPFIWAH